MSNIIGILGGGIGGLVSAYYLAQKALLTKTNITILLFEKSSRFGGWIKSNHLTKTYDKHIFELGPRTLRLKSGFSSLSNYPAINTLELLKNLQIFDTQFSPIETKSPTYRNRLIYYQNKLINLENLSIIYGGKPLKFPPFVYLLYEYFSPSIKVEDESIRSFLHRRLGDMLSEDIVEYLLDPLLKGIYAGSVNNLSAKTVLRKLFNSEQKYGSVIAGWNKMKIIDDKEQSIFDDLQHSNYKDLINKYSIYYFKDGMEILVQTLIKYLRSLPNIQLYENEAIEKIEFCQNSTVKLKTKLNRLINVDHLISALPSYELASIINNNNNLKTVLNRIPFVPMIVVNLLYSNKNIFPQSAFGYLIPSKEESYLLGVLFDSCVREQTDKEKMGSQLTVMMGGAWYDKLKLNRYSDEQLLKTIQNELKKHINLDEKPIHYQISRLNNAIPNYNVGHQNILDDLDTIIYKENLPLTLVGNSYRGVGINDVIYDARVEIEYLNLKEQRLIQRLEVN
ncbi:unnamed protein product [Didymodactylos carnosus]|uniref:Protoporphyrinogen oxidase n=1 Tax=Didymodactylos carnosus TaxID=1234261 RepID=A0A813RHB0_9BILA|nr:unnamed protein product [Didymodactylos carnosus]CAF1499900.1 unnamed protein product [Didymodactylos carnosus]CAF3564134.1 unnamed protein product [Didymodactylos carnosus]CAF4288456.1 unnamed protein product [Didymodactylos carnosus]